MTLRPAPRLCLAALLVCLPGCGRNTHSAKQVPTPTPTATPAAKPAIPPAPAPRASARRTGVPEPLQPFVKAHHRFDRAWARRATVWFIGVYGSGSYPCIPGPGGSMDMIEQNYFIVKKVVKGNVRVKTVDVNIHPRGKGNEVPPYVVDGRRYLVMLRPDPASVSLLSNPNTLFTLNNRLKRHEVIAILDLSKVSFEIKAERTKAYRIGKIGGFTFTPKKWQTLRNAPSADYRAQYAFLGFIRKVAAPRGATMAHVRSYLGKPDDQTRWKGGRHMYRYYLNLPAYRKPKDGVVYVQAVMTFGPDGKVLAVGATLARWSVKPGRVSSRVLTGAELNRFIRSRFKP